MCWVRLRNVCKNSTQVSKQSGLWYIETAGLFHGRDAGSWDHMRRVKWPSNVCGRVGCNLGSGSGLRSDGLASSPAIYIWAATRTTPWTGRDDFANLACRTYPTERNHWSKGSAPRYTATLLDYIWSSRGLAKSIPGPGMKRTTPSWRSTRLKRRHLPVFWFMSVFQVHGPGLYTSARSAT